MKYKLTEAAITDIPKIISYNEDNIIKYAGSLTDEELEQINFFCKEEVTNKIKDYQIITVDDEVVGCLLISNYSDGILIDELYLESEYRNKGIGTKILKVLLASNVYLWVYKKNEEAIKLYESLGLTKIDETETRYFMTNKKENQNG